LKVDAGPSRRGNRVPHFSFVVGCSGFVVDNDEYDGPEGNGAELASPEAARLCASAIIREFQRVGRYRDPGLAMFVMDADGEVLFSLPVLGSIH
jgi:hypothetical protein